MKKVLVILALFAVTGIASAEMLTNPQDLEGEALGFISTGVPMPGWESWGGGEGDGGWYSTWNGGQSTASVVDMGSTKGLLVDANPASNWYSYNLAFAHDNQISALPAGSNAPGELTLSFDVLATTGGNSIVKLEFYANYGDRSLAAGGVGEILIYAWDPIDLAPGTHSFIVAIPAGANYVTPVLGTTGPGSYAIYDNISLTGVVPEPTTIALLGLGGLLLRRKK